MIRNLWNFPSRYLMVENPWVRVSAVDPAGDFDNLYAAASLEASGEDLFRYHVNVPPMTGPEVFRTYLNAKAALTNEILYQIYSHRLGRTVGCASLMNIRVEHGTLEIGSIWLTTAAQKSEIHSQAMILLFSYDFEELGYRRLEWKCNNQNENSKRAAFRLGFTWEGLFRQHFLSRGENRDTAWFSLLDSEWPEKKKELLERIAKQKL